MLIFQSFGEPDIAGFIQIAGKKRYAALKSGSFFAFKNDQVQSVSNSPYPLEIYCKSTGVFI